MLTKTVLCPQPDGSCKLIEVEFSWQHGDPLPEHALETYFPNVADAMSEMAGRGRNSARVHVPKPERSSARASRDGDPS